MALRLPDPIIYHTCWGSEKGPPRGPQEASKSTLFPRPSASTAPPFPPPRHAPQEAPRTPPGGPHEASKRGSGHCGGIGAQRS